MRISLKEALLGFRRTLRHLDGHEVVVERRGVASAPASASASGGSGGSDVSEVTVPGQVIRIKGEGMPKHNTPSEHGDLLVE